MKIEWLIHKQEQHTVTREAEEIGGREEQWLQGRRRERKKDTVSFAFKEFLRENRTQNTKHKQQTQISMAGLIRKQIDAAVIN